MSEAPLAIRQALERAERLFTARLDAVRVTRRGQTTVREGLLCEYGEGDHRREAR